MLPVLFSASFRSYLVTGFSTDPPVMNGGTVDLPAVENATNVSVFCDVMFNDMSVGTAWLLGPDKMSTDLLVFNQPTSNFAIEDTIMRKNLTILLFSRASLDMVVLECTNGFGGALENAFFIPKFIG